MKIELNFTSLILCKTFNNAESLTYSLKSAFFEKLINRNQRSVDVHSFPVILKAWKEREREKVDRERKKFARENS